MEYETSYIEPSNSNGILIELKARFCDICGFTNDVYSFKNNLLNPLKELGYKIKYSIIKMPGGKGEYFISCIKNGQEKRVFSNNTKLHQGTGCIIGNKITQDNYEKVINLIIN